MKKRKAISIEVLGSGDFELVNDTIVSTSGRKFFVEQKGDKLVLSTSKKGSSGIFGSNISIGGSNISMNGNSISMNGNTISINNGVLTVDGDVHTVVVNGERVDISSKGRGRRPSESDGSVKEYDITDTIQAVSILGSGSFSFSGDNTDGRKCFSNTIVLSVSGSGDIFCSNFRKLSVVATVAGSGDISFNSVFGESLVATVAGSGDITNKGSSRFISSSTNVSGSGRIDSF